MKYPDFKKGLLWGSIAGGVAGLAVFGFACWNSTLPAVSEASLSLAFRPWWRWSNWIFALVLALFTGLVVGIRFAFRPFPGYGPEDGDAGDRSAI